MASVKRVNGGVSIQNLTRRTEAPSRAVLNTAAGRVLPHWEISLVFIGPAKAKELNQHLRRKEYTPNVLSYVVGEKSGEIIICISEAAKQAPNYGLGTREFILYLFIHGLLHLKGWAHGGTMLRRERKLLAEFAKSAVRPLPNVTTHRNRNRYRHVPSKSGRRRGSRG